MGQPHLWRKALLTYAEYGPGSEVPSGFVALNVTPAEAPLVRILLAVLWRVSIGRIAVKRTAFVPVSAGERVSVVGSQPVAVVIALYEGGIFAIDVMVRMMRRGQRSGCQRDQQGQQD
jgi:hypothetical protein